MLPVKVIWDQERIHMPVWLTAILVRQDSLVQSLKNFWWDPFPVGMFTATELIAREENVGFTTWCHERCAALHHGLFHHRIFFQINSSRPSLLGVWLYQISRPFVSLPKPNHLEESVLRFGGVESILSFQRLGEDWESTSEKSIPRISELLGGWAGFSISIPKIQPSPLYGLNTELM